MAPHEFHMPHIYKWTYVLVQSCVPGFPSHQQHLLPLLPLGAILHLLGHQMPLNQPFVLPTCLPINSTSIIPLGFRFLMSLTVLHTTSREPSPGLTFPLAQCPSEASPRPWGRVQTPFQESEKEKSSFKVLPSLLLIFCLCYLLKAQPFWLLLSPYGD